MEKFLIYGGNKLNGKLKIKGAKNSILPILSASIMCKDKVVLHNIPCLSDIHNMCDILRSIGCKVKEQKNKIIIDKTHYDPLLKNSEFDEPNTLLDENIGFNNIDLGVYNV